MKWHKTYAKVCFSWYQFFEDIFAFLNLEWLCHDSKICNNGQDLEVVLIRSRGAPLCAFDVCNKFHTFWIKQKKKLESTQWPLKYYHHILLTTSYSKIFYHLKTLACSLTGGRKNHDLLQNPERVFKVFSSHIF